MALFACDPNPEQPISLDVVLTLLAKTEIDLYNLHEQMRSEDEIETFNPKGNKRM